MCNILLRGIFSNISWLEDLEGFKSLDKFFKCCHVTDCCLDPENGKNKHKGNHRSISIRGSNRGVKLYCSNKGA